MKVVFLGNMNNLPFYFAKGLQQAGVDVTFIVDADKDFLLDRPESWDHSIGHTYPEWIIEMPLADRWRTFKFAFPKLCFKKYIKILNRYDVAFLNGHWISLGGSLKKNIQVIDIIAGYDLDILADYGQLHIFHQSLKSTNSLLSKLMPYTVADYCYKRLIGLQQKGIRRASVVNYYPTGINPHSDQLLNDIKAGQNFKRLELRGFDCDKFPYSAPATDRKKFVILNVTRFFYLNQRNSNKRNDIMIRGIGQFLQNNVVDTDTVEIIFFNKGEDLGAAKKLCDEYGLTPFIKWQPIVSAEALNEYFDQCDVAFDQLGEQWVGAGLFSMLTGRPLIANGRPDVFEKITGQQSPICQATNEEDVANWLTRLYTNRNLVKEIGMASREYVLQHYNLHDTVHFFINAFEKK
jgi:glycosyltransferase involved in cell wall biosynthesis